MAVVKVEKAATKEAHKAKKLAKLVAMAKLGFVKKLPKTSKGEREETSRPLNLGSGEKGASTRKECSKGEASKDSVQVVEQLWSTFGSSESSEEEEENLEIVSILKKPIKDFKVNKRVQKNPRGFRGSSNSKNPSGPRSEVVI
ncbi:unnamed protein product [Sphagnum balticum]